MKQWLNKIDSLSVFLLLSLVTLFSFVNDSTYFLPTSEDVGFKNYIDYRNVYDFPGQGILRGNKKMINYNSSYQLYYSINGGGNYKEYQNEDLLDLKSADITKEITSIRSKKPFGELPSVISILVKAKHKDKNIFTKPKQVTYFENFESSLPIVNLVVDESDLFDEFGGIMTLGEYSWCDEGFYKESWYRNANYNQRGDDWLKDVYFQYFEQNDLKYETKAGVQISGHASRSFPQKSMKIKSTIEEGKLAYRFFAKEGLNKYSSIVLRNSGNDNTKTLFADLLMHNLIKNEHVLSQKGKAVNVFLNGNYWGIYNLRERHNSYYIAKKENVKKNEITVLEKGSGTLKSGSSEVQEQYVTFIDKLLTLDPTQISSYEFAKENISIKSFTDYILIETYYGNSDWLHNNTLWYKAGDKKWKWLIVDLDNALAYGGEENINANYFDLLKRSQTITAKLFNFLIKNDRFNEKFKRRANELMNKTFSELKIQEEYNTLKNTISGSIDIHLRRWRGKLNRENWEKNCENNLNFLINRNTVFLKQIKEL